MTTEGFWRAFREKHWERAPLVFKLDCPLPDPEEVRLALIRAADTFRNPASMSRAGRLRFHANGMEQRIDLGSYLPTHADETIAGYVAAQSRRFDDGDISLELGGTHDFSQSIWWWARRFLRPVIASVGLPRVADSFLFVGNYTKSFFPIHRDAASVFAIVLSGRKRMRLWPFGEFPDHANAMTVDSSDYTRYAGNSIVLEGAAGDVMYWPSSYWHVGECVDGACATLNITLQLREKNKHIFGSMENLVDRILASRPDIVSRMDGAPYRLEDSDSKSHAPSPPSGLHALAANIEALALEAPGEILRGWLELVTSMGLGPVPKYATSSPAPSDQARLATDRIVHATEREAVICAANGHSMVVPQEAGAIGLIDEINADRSLAIQGLIERNCVDAGHGLELLETFQKWGAIFVERRSET